MTNPIPNDSFRLIPIIFRKMRIYPKPNPGGMYWNCIGPICFGGSDGGHLVLLEGIINHDRAMS